MQNKRKSLHQKKHLKHEAGYSLIEIAIALVIIGLIISAVLKGYDVLENAQLKSVMMQLNEYRLAMHTFEEKYGAKPGTLKNASTIFPSLETQYNGTTPSYSPGGGLDKSTAIGKVWIQLAAADLIGDPGLPQGPHLAAKQGAPSTKIGGVVALEQSPPNMPGLWFVIGNENADKNNNALFTPVQAMQLMQQFDTDLPGKGRVRAQDGHDTPNKCIQGDVLNLTHSDKACVLYVKV